MIALGPLAFATPWALLGLLALPVIWWLLKVTSPAPHRVRFPAIRLLVGLVPETETPAHTPLWLLLLRLAIATLIILALASPLWQPAERLAGQGPLLLLVDNGWPSAADWPRRTALAESLIAQAEEADRRVAVLGTAPEAAPRSLTFGTADTALGKLAALQPQPFLPDRRAISRQIENAAEQPAQLVWISDGLDHGSAASVADRLSDLGIGVDLVEPAAAEQVLALLPPSMESGAMTVTVRRPSPNAPGEGSLTAFAADGRPLAHESFTFAPDTLETQTVLSLPLELRNEITRLSLDGAATAGGTVLLDERWRRHTLGLVSGNDSEQPLLSDLYYLERALEPYVDVRKPDTGESGESPVENLLAEPLSVLLLADIGRLGDEEAEKVGNWVLNGGVLVRFAGPRLAAQADALIPVPLRAGGRELGGALSWTEPQHLAPFGPDSPFAGIPVPDDVIVKRQVLADPRGDLSGRIWARLEDGTPLVTARAEGAGWVVLVHVTANAEWSNLAFSGLYVEMLRRLVDLSQGLAPVEGETNGAANLPPRQTLDAFGRFTQPPAWATPLPRADIDKTTPSALHPPGLYGDAGAARALNTNKASSRLTPLPALSGLASRRAFAAGTEQTLKTPLLIAALLLLLADGVAALVLTGRLSRKTLRPGTTTAALMFLTVFGIAMTQPRPALADETAADEAAALAAVLETHLAFVVTGNTALDEVSRAGLQGLSDTLRRRTALEPGAPIGVNIERDELAFFPLLYWPVGPAQPPLSEAARARIDSYMKHGGTILFDTRDQDQTIKGLTTDASQRLRDILNQLDIPPLEPVPDTHVLTRAFYLLADFPGRWDGGPLWVERTRASDGATASSNDGVSSILIGSNDYAGAWARDEAGRALYAAVPGGERQREIASRFGVNLVMYALTGNYKADQVHLPALLERLGQ